jgi:thiol-disulfide isomerase/thioredoxin
MERVCNVLHGGVLRLLVCLLALSLVHCEVQVLTDDNWNMMLNGEQWLVEFYAPWCGACKAFASTWDQFGEEAGALSVRVGKADITENGGLAGRFMISHLPTLYHVSSDGEFRKYSGSRRLEELSAFIKEEKWKDVEPVVWYMKPNSLNMEAAAILTNVGTKAQDISNTLMQEHGVPKWGIVVLVVLVILIIGITIGIAANLLLERVMSRRAPAKGPAPPTEKIEGEDGKGDTEEKKDR